MKKRILVLILALTIPFSVMGCGRKEEKVSISDSVEATDSGSVEKEQKSITAWKVQKQYQMKT